MKCLVLIPPAIKPTMASRNAGSIAGILKKQYPIVDVLDLNNLFFDHIYKNYLVIKTKEKETVLHSDELAGCFQTYKDKNALDENVYKKIVNVVRVRDFFLESIISDFRFGFLSVYLSNPEQLCEKLENHSFNEILKDMVLELIPSFDYDMVVMNLDSLRQIYFSALITDLFRSKSKTKIMIYGQYVNSLIDETLVKQLTDYFDYVVHVDFREKLMQLYEWRKVNLLVASRGRDLLPVQWMDYKLEDEDNKDLYDPLFFADYSYYYPFIKYPIRFSIGCFYAQCKFCIHNIIRHKPTQKFTISEVFAEVIKANEKGYSFFEFIDVNVPACLLIELSKMVEKCHLDISWTANTRLYEEFTDINNCEVIAKSGCKKLFIGYESYCQEILDECHKGIKTQNMARVLRNLKTAGINTHISFLFGLPNETRIQAEKTKDFICNHIDLMDIVEINRYVAHDQSFFEEEYNVNEFVLELRRMIELKQKDASFFNVYKKLI